MQFFSASPSPRSLPKPPMAGPTTGPMASGGAVVNGRPDICGWFDSSFDLATGLEVSEQDSDTLYQLWAFARN